MNMVRRQETGCATPMTFTVIQSPDPFMGNQFEFQTWTMNHCQ